MSRSSRHEVAHWNGLCRYFNGCDGQGANCQGPNCRAAKEPVGCQEDDVSPSAVAR